MPMAGRNQACIENLDTWAEMYAVFLSKWHLFKGLPIKLIVSMKGLYIFVLIYPFVVFSLYVDVQYGKTI